MKISLRNLKGTAAGLTQAARLLTDSLPVGVLTTPRIFHRTSAASRTGDILFSVGTGVADSKILVRMLVQHAQDRGVPVQEVGTEFIDIIRVFGLDANYFQKLIAAIVGSNDRAVATNRLVMMTPTFVHTQIAALLPEVDPLYIHLLTDLFCHWTAPFGWILRDVPYTYRAKAHAIYPTHAKLVDAVVSLDLDRMISTIIGAKFDLVAKALSAKQSVSPIMIAQQMSASLTVAEQSIRGQYDATSVVDTVLDVLHRMHSPVLAKEMAVSARITKVPQIAELSGNLALFLAHQEMLTSGHSPVLVQYSDEEIATQIIPAFAAALNEFSSFKLRLLSDSVAFLGKKSTYAYDGQLGHSVVYEDWRFGGSVTGFTAIRRSRNGDERFLVEELAVSTALTSAAAPIESVLSVSRLVDQRMATYAMTDATRPVPQSGPEITLGFPSLVERSVRLDGDSRAFVVGVQLGSAYRPPMIESEVDSMRDPMSKASFAQLNFDYYSTLVHLAVARSQSVHMAVAESGVPYLIWTHRAPVVVPFGESAVSAGTVMTTEPIEAIAYTDDFVPTESLTFREPPIKEHQSDLHIWNWADASASLSFKQQYTARIQNAEFSVNVDEHEILGLGAMRRRTRFLVPTAAMAVVRTWLDWTVEEDRYLQEEAKTSKDDLTTIALRGRRLQNSMAMAATLIHIGSTGVGERAAGYVHRKLRDELYAAGAIDSYSDLKVGIQNHKIRIWAGLVTLQLLGLISEDDTNQIVKDLTSSDALTMMVGTIDLPSMT